MAVFVWCRWWESANFVVSPARRPKSFAFQYPSPIFLLKTIINRFLNAKTLSGFDSLSLKNKDTACRQCLCFLVQVVGIEPTRYHYHRILSPARLPVPPHLRIPCYDSTDAYFCQYFYILFIVSSISARVALKVP